MAKGRKKKEIETSIKATASVADKGVHVIIKISDKRGKKQVIGYELYEDGILIEESKEPKYTRMAIHGVKQFFGDNRQLSLFSDKQVDEYVKDTGLTIREKPDSYGVALNQAQKRVYEGILKAFSDTNYKGQYQVDRNDSLKEEGNMKLDYNKGVNRIKEIYKGIDKVPVVRLTQAELIELSGYDLKKQRQEDKNDVIEALEFLATKQFCFYWLRLKHDEKGKIVKDKAGNYAKEEVMEVGTIFRIKTVREEGILRYYEIHPSAPILDQIDNYFLMIPDNWREEVKTLTGVRASKYTYHFLEWLRLQYEEIRRYNSNKAHSKKKPFEISKAWEEIAIALKMPESIYKSNRKRAASIIKQSYDIAISLGYLTKVDNTGAVDKLYLNENYYPKPGELI